MTDMLWIGVNSLGIPDLATLHVDRHDCQELIDGIVQEEGDVLLVPRRCALAIAPAADDAAGEKAGLTQASDSLARPSSSPSPTVRDALDHLHAMAPGIRDLDALDAVEKDDESMRSAVRDVTLREALERAANDLMLAAGAAAKANQPGTANALRECAQQARAALSPLSLSPPEGGTIKS